MTDDITIKSLGTDQATITQHGCQHRKQHGDGAVQAPIQQQTTGQTAHGAGEGGQADAGRNSLGAEGGMVEDQGGEIDDAPRSNGSDQAD